MVAPDPTATKGPPLFVDEILDSGRSEEHTSELQSHVKIVCRLLLEKKTDVLIKRVELVLQRLARAEQITANFAVHLQQKTRFRFVIGVVRGEKISEQFSILVHRIDRVAEKSGIAAEFPYRFAVGSAIAANEERLVIVACHLRMAVF